MREGLIKEVIKVGEGWGLGCRLVGLHRKVTFANSHLLCLQTD